LFFKNQCRSTTEAQVAEKINMTNHQATSMLSDHFSQGSNVKAVC